MAPVIDRVVLLRIPVPEELVAHFEAQPFLGVDMTVEDKIVRHLARTKDCAEFGIVLTEAEAAQIRQLLGGAINSGSKLVDMIRRLKSIKLADRSIEFTVGRLEALEYKARAMGMSLDDALPQIADAAFGQYLGA